MQELYTTLEAGGIGLFESPTGTGKTISLICGALHWLEDFRQREAEAKAAQPAGCDDDDPDWLKEVHRESQASAPAEPHPWLRRCAAAPPANAARLVQAHTLGAPQHAPLRRPAAAAGSAAAATAPADGAAARADEEFLLAPTAADEEGDEAAAAAARLRRARAAALAGSSSDEDGADGERSAQREALGALRAPPAPPRRTPQVFFASRTHSQLAQFVAELRRTGFASRLTLVSLASRRGLCVHEPVASLGAAGLIAERCTELQERNKGSKARKTAPAAGAATGCGGSGCAGAGAARRRARSRGGGGGGGCPFLSIDVEAAEGFAEEVLREPLDVEDLGRVGRRHGLCPYYGSRSLVSEADVVALPYSALLCEETRGSLGLRLEGAVVIFDEAHNLVDAVTGSHGAAVSLEQLRAAARQLTSYFSRFQAALSPANARHVQLLIRIAAALERTVAPPPPPPATQATQAHVGAVPTHGSAAAPATSGGGGGVEVTSCHEFLCGSRLDHINLFPLLGWVRETRLVMKVAGYDLANVPPDMATAVGDNATAAAAAMLDADDDSGGGGRSGGGGVPVSGTTAAAKATATVTSRHARRRVGTGEQAEPGAGSAAGAAAAATAPNAQAAAAAVAAAGGFGARRSALFALVSFLSALTQPNADGRIIITRCPSPSSLSPSSSSPSYPSSSSPSSSSTTPDLEPGLRYTVLNAAAPFASLLASARSVILASGTLSPVAGLTAQLLPGVPPGRVRHFACGHVVPPENLMALVAGSGPGGSALDLRHGRRSDPRVVEEIGRLLVNICTAVPAGVVVFAPSFSYLDQLVSAWQRSGVWASLAARKHVFSEPRGPGHVEAVLAAYAAACRPPPAAAASATQAQTQTQAHVQSLSSIAGGGQQREQQPAAGAARRVGPSGALLLSVVGGKLSEGINFGDDLGRCVVVLGLPYPNPTDPELRERMRYLDEAAAAAAATSAPGSAAAAAAAGASGAAQPSASGSSGGPRLSGRQYYEGLCIKAVNQCVGRVIRHAGDYAAIVLADCRYQPPPPPAAGGGGSGGNAVLRTLPGWIQQSLRTGAGDFAHVYGNLVSFFRGRAAATAAAAAAARAGTAGATAGSGA